MKHYYRLLYKPPIQFLDDDNPDSWRKVFYIDKAEASTELDLNVKILALRQLYNMNPEYITIEDLEDL